MTTGIYYVDVVLDLYDGSGNQIEAGQASLTLTSMLIDTTDGMLIAQAPITGVFRAGSLPQPSLIANDSPNVDPALSQWQIAYTGVPGSPPPYSFSVLAAPFSFTATNATPCVFTAAGSSYANGTVVALYGGSLPAGFSTGTDYYVVSASGTSFSLAATAGGPPIASTSTGTGTVATARVLLSSLTPASVSPATSPFLTVSGVPSAGQVPIATGTGQQADWGDPTGLPLTTLGDTLYENATPAAARLAGNTTTTRKFLRQQGTGTISAAPAWDTLQAGDIPDISASYVAVGQAASGRVIAKSVALTDASTIAVDASLGNVYTVTLGGNRTMGTPSNAPSSGSQQITFEIVQDGTGSRTLTWASGYDFGAAGAPTLTTTAGESDEAAFRYSQRSGKWRFLGDLGGYA